MFPCYAMCYLPYGVIRQIQTFGYRVHRHRFIEFSDVSNVRFLYLCLDALFSLMMMKPVRMTIHIHQILKTVIQSVFVLVMHMMAFGTRPQKGERDQFVNIPFASLVFLEKPKIMVSVFYAESLVFAVMRLRESALGGNALRESFDLTKIADLIQAFIARYVAIFFGGIIGIHQKLALLVSSLGTFGDVAEAILIRVASVSISQSREMAV